MIPSSSPRVITQASPKTQGDGPAQEAEAPQGPLQIQAGLASNNVNPSEQASAHTASRETPAGEPRVGAGLTQSASTLGLPNSSSPHEKGSLARLRPSGTGLQNFLHRRPPSNLPLDNWDRVETKQAPARESVSTASTGSTASISSPAGSPLARSPSNLGSPVDGHGTSPAGSPSGRSSFSNLKAFMTRKLSHSSSKHEKPSSPFSNSSSSGSGSSSSSSSSAGQGHRASAVGRVWSTSAARAASPHPNDYENMDAVLSNPEATNNLRMFIRKGYERTGPEEMTEGLDFLLGFKDFAAETDPAEQRRLLKELITTFVLTRSPRELNLPSNTRSDVLAAWNAWDRDGEAAIPEVLLAALRVAKRDTAKLLESIGNFLPLLRTELFPPPDDSEAKRS